MTIIKLAVIVLVSLYLLVGIGLYIFQENLIFRPTTLPLDHVYDFDVPFEELNLAMSDGATLNALYFNSETPKGLILYFHGNAGDLERWGEIVSPFTKFDHDVLVIDYRGYGKSTGKRTKRRMLEDAEEVFKYALTKWSENDITLYGRSMGSSFACYLAGKHKPRQLILESAFQSVGDIGSRSGWIYPTNVILRFNFNNQESLRTATSPISLIHGTDDYIVSQDSGLKLFESLDKKLASFYSIEDGGHNDLSEFTEYWQIVKGKLRSE